MDHKNGEEVHTQNLENMWFGRKENYSDILGRWTIYLCHIYTDSVPKLKTSVHFLVVLAQVGTT